MKRALILITICLAAAQAIPARAQNADALTFRQAFFYYSVTGYFYGHLFSASVSPDGHDVYVSSPSLNAVLHFRRNRTDGTLEFANTTPVSLPNFSMAVTPYGIAISSDGKFLYAAVEGPVSGIVCFSRNSTTGNLTANGALPADGVLLPGLHAPLLITVSPDNRNLYVLNEFFPNGPIYDASLSVVSTDPATGAMTFLQKFDLSNNLPPIPGGEQFAATIADVAVSPDGKNVYVARAFNESLDAYTRDGATGELTFLGATYLRATPRGFVRSVAVSPDGKSVYATEGMGGTLYTLSRAADGSLSVSGTGEPLRGAGDTLVSPDGARVYASAQWPGEFAQVNAYGRDTVTGELNLIETIDDGIAQDFSIYDTPGLAAVSPDSANLYLPASVYGSLTVFSVDRPDLPCEDFPAITDEYAALAKAFDLYDDVNFDGLPEMAALALLEEASCANVDDAFDEAITNSYLLDLTAVANEPAFSDDDWSPYRHVVAALVSTSTSMRTYLNEATVPFGMDLRSYYVSVSCTDSACEPANTRGIPSDEPFSGAGDPDNDGVTNAQEWANVLARGGSEREFAVSALDPTNDGSRAVTFSSGGNGGACFIATAAYGTPLADELGALRAIRDSSLLTNALGAAFTDVYYRLSPPAADFIAAHPAYRHAAHWLLASAVAQPGLLCIAGVLALMMAISLRRRAR